MQSADGSFTRDRVPNNAHLPISPFSSIACVRIIVCLYSTRTRRSPVVLLAITVRLETHFQGSRGAGGFVNALQYLPVYSHAERFRQNRVVVGDRVLLWDQRLRVSQLGREVGRMRVRHRLCFVAGQIASRDGIDHRRPLTTPNSLRRGRPWLQSN